MAACRGRAPTGHLRDRHRTRLPLRQVSADYSFDRQVPGELAQVGPGVRGIGGRGSLLELSSVGRPSVYASLRTSTTLSRSCRRHGSVGRSSARTFLVFLNDLDSASDGNPAAEPAFRMACAWPPPSGRASNLLASRSAGRIMLAHHETHGHSSAPDATAISEPAPAVASRQLLAYR